VTKSTVGRIPAPQGSRDCCPEVQLATSTEYRLVSPAKQSNFVWGQLLPNGQLSFIVENLPKTTPHTGCPGRWIFAQMMNHFGSSVTGIEGNWIGPSSENLRELNHLTAKGLTLELAARSTWTGTRAKEYGFIQYEEVSTHGTPGNYSAVRVRFKT
jgi:hypothetical protein